MIKKFLNIKFSMKLHHKKTLQSRYDATSDVNQKNDDFFFHRMWKILTDTYSVLLVYLLYYIVV